MPERLDLGAVRLEEGYFLLRDDRPARPPFLTASPRAGDYRHCYTYAGSPPVIKEALLEILAQARRKIFVTSFRIGDRDLLESLYEAAQRLRGGVYVITALDEASLRRGLAEIEDDTDADVQAQNKRFEEMTRRGISIRGHSACHAKFVVVDDEVALVSSANLETRAFHQTGENGVVLTDRREVDRLARLFTRLWHAGCDWEMPPGEGYAVKKRAAESCPCSVPLPKLAEPGVLWTDRDEHFILQAIHDIIARAERELVLATFSLSGLSERPDILFDPLCRAMEKHRLRVRLLVRARNNLPSHRRDAQTLAALGVEIHADSLNHAKAAIADGRHGALFSANFDVAHGLESGVEVGTRLDGLPALADAAAYFEHALTHADLTFSPRPTQAEMDRFLAAAWRRPWPLGAAARVAASNEDWGALRAAVARGPVLYSKAEGEPVHLHAGGCRWALGEMPVPGLFRLAAVETGAGENAAGLLEEWLSARGPAPPLRGFCPAVLEKSPLPYLGNTR